MTDYIPGGYREPRPVEETTPHNETMRQIATETLMVLIDCSDGCAATLNSIVGQESTDKRDMHGVADKALNLREQMLLIRELALKTSANLRTIYEVIEG